ncbi:MAG: LCP family protein, partial [Candidatus Saccharimonadales bacterium]
MQFEDNKHRYKKYPRQTVSRPVIDGFIAHTPTRQQQFAATAGRPTIAKAPTAGRLIGDFKRPSGYHAHIQQIQATPASIQPPEFVRASQATRNISGTLPRSSTTLLNSSQKVSDATARKSHRFSWRKARRWSLRGSAALAASALIIGGFLVLKGFLQLHNVFQGHGTATALQSNVNPDQLKGVGDGRINILLLGVGGAGHDGPDLTDTMMLASVDPVNNKVALMSIPRDLWVKEPNGYISDYGKINAAYESGKYQYLGQEDSANSNQKA